MKSSIKLPIIILGFFLTSMSNGQSQVSYEWRGDQDQIYVMVSGKIALKIWRTLDRELKVRPHPTNLRLKIGRNIACTKVRRAELRWQGSHCAFVIDRRGGMNQTSQHQAIASFAREPIFKLDIEGEVAEEIMNFLDVPSRIETTESVTVRGLNLACKQDLQQQSTHCSFEISAGGRSRPGGFDPLVRVGNGGKVKKVSTLPNDDAASQL